MKSYYISKGTEKKGPYSLEELISMSLTNEYLIWKEGFESWKKTNEVEELKNHIITTPPPTPRELQKDKAKQNIIQSAIISIICLILIWFILLIFMGGFMEDYQLEGRYGYNSDFKIYGSGSSIRETLILMALLISGIISLLLFFIMYYNKKNSTSEL